MLAPFLRESLRQIAAHAKRFAYPPPSETALPPAEKGRLLTFCAKLGHLLRAEPCEGNRLHVTLVSRATSFIGGGWGEAVTLYLVDKTLKAFSKARPLSHTLFWNVQLGEPGDDKPCMELDVVAQVEDRFYLFESKTGLTLDVGKWVDRARRFGEAGRSVFLVCTPRDEIDPRYFRPFSLLPFSRLEEKFTAMLRHDFPPNGQGKGECGDPSAQNAGR